MYPLKDRTITEGGKGRPRAILRADKLDFEDIAKRVAEPVVSLYQRSMANPRACIFKSKSLQSKHRIVREFSSSSIELPFLHLISPQPLQDFVRLADEARWTKVISERRMARELEGT